MADKGFHYVTSHRTYSRLAELVDSTYRELATGVWRNDSR